MIRNLYSQEVESCGSQKSQALWHLEDLGLSFYTLITLYWSNLFKLSVSLFPNLQIRVITLITKRLIIKTVGSFFTQERGKLFCLKKHEKLFQCEFFLNEIKSYFMTFSRIYNLWILIYYQYFLCHEAIVFS